MLFPLEQMSVVTVTDAKPNHLLVCDDRDATLLWIVGEEEPRAVFLSGEYARHSFPIAGASGWRGVQVGPVEVRIDPTSVHDGRDEIKGNLSATEGTLSASVISKEMGFNQESRHPIASFASEPNRTVYFSKWALGVQRGHAWVELVTFNGGKAEGPMIQSAPDAE